MKFSTQRGFPRDKSFGYPKADVKKAV